MTHDPENCPGCRPVVFNPATFRALPSSHPAQRAADQAWRDALPAVRVAWHRVTCLNSRNPVDVAMARTLADAVGGS